MSHNKDISRLALGVAYHGANYHGWQSQANPKVQTIQDCVEEALSRIADAPIQTVCAGRTDKGVHATGQVIHFDTPEPRTLQAWVYGTNTYLPDDISIQWAKCVTDDFHARFSVVERCYRYTIYNHPTPSPLWHALMTWIPQPLDINAMQEAAQYLCGEHDFSSFRASGCQSKTPIRNLYKLDVTRHAFDKSCIQIDAHADAFLYRMVRNIVGLLIMVGRGKRSPGWVSDVLAAHDRRACAAPTASANGLCLVKIKY